MILEVIALQHLRFLSAANCFDLSSLSSYLFLSSAITRLAKNLAAFGLRCGCCGFPSIRVAIG